jgi:hypothetical protein
MNIKKTDFVKADSDFAKAFLFIYSMETFIPYEINRASREKD